MNTPAKTHAVGRFQICRQSRAGIYISTVMADSDTEVVEAFMDQAPEFERGEIRLVERDTQRVVASVKWKMGTTEIGLRVLHRQNVFYDWHLALIACEVQKRRSVQTTVELGV